MRNQDKIDLATMVMWAAWGRPYKWGGDDPMDGFDCSGVVIEALRSVGLLPRSGDWSAATLHGMFPAVSTPQEGCLAFWAGSNGMINHVAYCLDGEHCIEAGGGGSTTTSESAAIAQNAYTRVRTLSSRPGLVSFVDPFAE